MSQKTRIEQKLVHRDPGKSTSVHPYELIWRNKYLTADATTIDDMIQCLQSAADELRAMKAAGVILAEDCAVADDFALLITKDPKVAQQFGFEELEGEEEE